MLPNSKQLFYCCTIFSERKILWHLKFYSSFWFNEYREHDGWGIKTIVFKWLNITYYICFRAGVGYLSLSLSLSFLLTQMWLSRYHMISQVWIWFTSWETVFNVQHQHFQINKWAVKQVSPSFTLSLSFSFSFSDSLTLFLDLNLKAKQ